jgi:hypothetical protein
MFYGLAHDLVQQHPMPNKGQAIDLAHQCWHGTVKFLWTDEAISAVKALAVKIEDARDLKGFEVQDAISAHFIQPSNPEVLQGS